MIEQFKFKGGDIIHHQLNPDNKMYINARAFDYDRNKRIYLISDDARSTWWDAEQVERLWEKCK